MRVRPCVFACGVIYHANLIQPPNCLPVHTCISQHLLRSTGSDSPMRSHSGFFGPATDTTGLFYILAMAPPPLPCRCEGLVAVHMTRPLPPAPQSTATLSLAGRLPPSFRQDSPAPGRLTTSRAPHGFAAPTEHSPPSPTGRKAPAPRTPSYTDAAAANAKGIAGMGRGLGVVTGVLRWPARCVVSRFSVVCVTPCTGPPDAFPRVRSGAPRMFYPRDSPDRVIGLEG